MKREGGSPLSLFKLLTEWLPTKCSVGIFYCLTMYAIKSVICSSDQPMFLRYSIILLMALSLNDSIPNSFLHAIIGFSPRISLAVPGHCWGTYAPTNHASNASGAVTTD